MKITFIGGGFMGEAILNGALSRNAVSNHAFTVVEIDPSRRDYLHDKYDVEVVDGSQTESTVSEADVVILCMKPQQFPETIRLIKPAIRSEALLLSVAAGIPLNRIIYESKHEQAARIMPNLPAARGQGAAAIFFGNNFPIDGKLLVTELIRSSSPVVAEVHSDDEIDICTALNGSGPAYIFLIIEALVQAAVSRNIDEDLAHQLVIHTVLGAAVHAMESQTSVEQLRDNVTSPGGTTEAAITTLEAGNLRKVIDSAVQAAYDRAVELRD